MRAESDITTMSHWQLIEHILLRYHEPLRDELERLDALVLQVLRAQGDRDRRLVASLADTFGLLRVDLREHLMKEERVLFPWVLSGRPLPATGPIRQMLHERGQVGPLLDRLRELTGGYTVPEGVGATWRTLWDGLRALDHGLREHMRVEDEVLFPRVTAHG